MKNLFLLFSTLLLSVAAYGFGDEDPLKTLLSKLEKLRTDYPYEKVHLHLDKPYYTVGDTIWFKTYVVNGENQLSGLSRIVYVELINEKDSIKRSLRLPLTAGLGWGDFILADSLKEGNYRIRAYTNWMRNFGEEYFYDKTLKIGNAYSNDILAKADYSYSKIGTHEKVEVTLSYKDFEGKPLAKKEVSYEVKLNFRDIIKGKGITDDNGILAFSFINTQPFILKSGKINTAIKVDNRFMTKNFPIQSTNNDVDVQFFPEGGQLVNHIRSKVAFKALKSDGLSTSVSGYIIDQNKKKITEFQSTHAGMGCFFIEPETNTSYTAIIKHEDGTERQIALPKALNEGYVLALNNVSDSTNLYLKISASPELVTGKDIILVAQSNHVIQYVSKTKLDKPILSTTLPKKRFPTGILQLTLFSPDYQPMAERLIFIQNNDNLKFRVSTDKTEYSSREKVKMALEVKDDKGNPVQGSFSVAITDYTKVPVNESDENSILSNLLLTTLIQGYIENPNYYFTSVNENKIKDLDNLLLTQGWRRFIWKNILNNAYPPLIFSPEQDFKISGKVLTASGKPVARGKVTLFSTSGTTLTLDTITNMQGEFTFSDLVFEENTKFVIRAENSDGRKNVEIEVNQIPPQLVTRNKNAPEIEININNTLLPYIKNSTERLNELTKYGLAKKSIQLAEVKVTEKKPLVKNSSNLNGAGNADQIITGDQLKNCITLIQCLQRTIRGVIFSGGLPYNTRGNRLMNVMVDGTFTAPDYINIVNPEDVESIEVIRNGSNLAIYGLQAGNGILMINTKHGELNYSATNYAKGALSYTPQGYYIGRDFYAPTYEIQTTSKIKDLRTTIYWKPNIVTDASGKASIEFYTADTAGTYRTVIEGLTLDGKLGRTVYMYQVNKINK